MKDPLIKTIKLSDTYKLKIINTFKFEHYGFKHEPAYTAAIFKKDKSVGCVYISKINGKFNIAPLERPYIRDGRAEISKSIKVKFLHEVIKFLHNKELKVCFHDSNYHVDNHYNPLFKNKTLSNYRLYKKVNYNSVRYSIVEKSSGKCKPGKI